MSIQNVVLIGGGVLGSQIAYQTAAYNILTNNPAAADPNTTYGKMAKRLKEEYIDTGKLGINAGEGFYKYK